MEGAVRLGGIWCHKEKELAVYYGCWAGGSGTGSWGQGAPAPPGAVDGQGCFSVGRCMGSRIVLHCSPALDGAFGEGAWELGGFVPSHSTWLDWAGRLMESPAELSGGVL